jgi:exonuclease VII small subunit
VPACRFDRLDPLVERREHFGELRVHDCAIPTDAFERKFHIVSQRFQQNPMSVELPVDLFEAQVDLLESLVNLLEPGVDLLESGVNLPESGVDLLESGVNLLESGVNLPESGVDLFESNVDLLKAGVDLLKALVNPREARIHLVIKPIDLLINLIDSLIKSTDRLIKVIESFEDFLHGLPMSDIERYVSGSPLIRPFGDCGWGGGSPRDVMGDDPGGAFFPRRRAGEPPRAPASALRSRARAHIA